MEARAGRSRRALDGRCPHRRRGARRARCVRRVRGERARRHRTSHHRRALDERILRVGPGRRRAGRHREPGGLGRRGRGEGDEARGRRGGGDGRGRERRLRIRQRAERDDGSDDRRRLGERADLGDLVGVVEPRERGKRRARSGQPHGAARLGDRGVVVAHDADLAARIGGDVVLRAGGLDEREQRRPVEHARRGLVHRGGDHRQGDGLRLPAVFCALGGQRGESGAGSGKARRRWGHRVRGSSQPTCHAGLRASAPEPAGAVCLRALVCWE